MPNENGCPKTAKDFADVAQRLKKVEVLRFEDNTMIRIDELRKDKKTGATVPVLICFFRRWGCALCKMSAVNISNMKPFLDQKGVKLIGIGVEKLNYENFVENGYFAGEMYIDEPKAGYAALDLKKNTWRNFWGIGTHLLKLFRQATKKGYSNTMKGDTQQLGGTFLIDADGTCLYAHEQTGQSFEPNVLQILEALHVEVPRDFELYPSHSQRKQFRMTTSSSSASSSPSTTTNNSVVTNPALSDS